MLQQLFAIGRNTFTESIRQPIFTVLILAGGLALILNPMLAAYSMEHGRGDNKMLIDLGLSTVFLVGLLLAAFTATGVLSQEIENKTVLTVVSKPVPRWLFVVGKFLGVAAAISVAYYVLSIGLLLSIRHEVMSTASDRLDGPVLLFGLGSVAIALLLAAAGNYFFRWVFTSTFVGTLAITLSLGGLLVTMLGKGFVFQSPLTDFTKYDGEMTEVLLGLIMVQEAVWILTAVAIACSTRLGQVMTLLICVGMFLLGLISNSFNALAVRQLKVPAQDGFFDTLSAIFQADASLGMKLLFAAIRTFYILIPNLQFLWPADAITQGHSLYHNIEGQISFAYLGSVSAYSALYLLAVLTLAVILFQKREVS